MLIEAEFVVGCRTQDIDLIVGAIDHRSEGTVPELAGLGVEPFGRLGLDRRDLFAERNRAAVEEVVIRPVGIQVEFIDFFQVCTFL